MSRTALSSISAILGLAFCASLQADPFAHYNGDFSGTAFPSGWQYMWNAPDDWDGTTATDSSTAPFGAPGNYNNLLWNGSNWTADGDANSGNGTPARFLRLNATSGHPGRGSSQPETTGNSHDRYAIMAYTLSASDLPSGSGPVFLTGSNAGVAGAAGGVRVDTHINGNPISKTVAVAGATNRQFDQYLGNLNVGDTVYVGVGPSVADGNDTFTVDFQLALPSTTTAYLMADFRDEYQDGTMPANWRYMWNAPTDWNGTSSSDASTGAITSVADFELLNSVGGTSWRPDTDTTTSNGAPGNFLNLSATGGHPGRGSSQAEGIGNNQDRYVITAYDVSLTGIYSITDSFFSTIDGNGAGNNVRIFTSANPTAPLFDSVFANVVDGNFDTSIGTLNAGDTIFVAVGPNGQDGADSFDIDYSIRFQIPEPSSLMLLGLGMVLLIQRRRIKA
jgi:hypothetical protein